MKRTLLIWLGLVALAFVPASAQNGNGKIHGHITDVDGLPRTNGAVSLTQDVGKTNKYTFPVSATGDYSGEAKPGTYMVVYRRPETAPDKIVDGIDNVKVVADTDVAQDLDMTRKEFMDRLTPEQRKQIEEVRKKNAEIIKANETIKSLNEDLGIVRQSIKDKKYEDAEALMLKDTAALPDSALLWTELGVAQMDLGTKNKNDADVLKTKYDSATTAFKKALTLDAAAKKPNSEVEGLSNSGLGEIAARTGKVADANAAFDAAAKADPTKAALYLSNQAIIFYQVFNADAQIAAADIAIKTNPNAALMYYIKGNGLVQKATVDPKTQRIVLPPGCADAYQQYLTLAPDGQFANEVKAILSQAGQKINSSFKSGKK